MGFLVAGIIASYFIIGLIVSRITFARTLGDAKRWYKNGVSTEIYDLARWYAFFGLFTWPAVLICAFITQTTPREKLRFREERLEQQKSEIERLAKEYNLTLPKE